MKCEIRSGLGVMAVEMRRKLKGLVTNCHWEGEWSQNINFKGCGEGLN